MVDNIFSQYIEIQDKLDQQCTTRNEIYIFLNNLLSCISNNYYLRKHSGDVLQVWYESESYQIGICLNINQMNQWSLFKRSVIFLTRIRATRTMIPYESDLNGDSKRNTILFDLLCFNMYNLYNDKRKLSILVSNYTFTLPSKHFLIKQLTQNNV